MAAISTVVAVASAGSAIAGGIQAGEAGRKQARATKRAANAQVDAATKAQELLQKRIDEAVSNEDAAQLRQQGLISDAEETRIQEINRSEEGFTQRISSLQLESKSEEENILEDIAQSGVISRQELESGVLDAIGKDIGFSEEAVSALSPFNEAGLRALKQQQFLSGQLTQEEQQQHIEEFGDPREAQSGLRQAAEQSLLRRQRAIGASQSGIGLEQFGRLGAELQQQQFQQAGTIAGRGQQAATGIAGIQERLGGRVSSLQNLLATNRANQRANEQARRTGVQQTGAGQRLGLGQQAAQVGLQAGQQRGEVRERARLNLANVVGSTAARKSQLLVGGAEKIGNLGFQGAQAAAGGFERAAGQKGAAGLLPFQGLVTGAGILGELSGFNTGQGG